MTHVTHPIFVTHLTHDPWPIDPFPALMYSIYLTPHCCTLTDWLTDWVNVYHTQVRFCFWTISVIRFVFCLLVTRERLNGFAPNLQRRRVWSLALTSLNVKLKGEGHHGQKKRKLLSHPHWQCIVKRAGDRVTSALTDSHLRWCMFGKHL